MNMSFFFFLFLFFFLLCRGRHRRRKYLGAPPAATAAEFCSFSAHHTHLHGTCFLFVFHSPAATVAADICFDFWWEQRDGGGGEVPDLEEMRERERQDAERQH